MLERDEVFAAPAAGDFDTVIVGAGAAGFLVTTKLTIVEDWVLAFVMAGLVPIGAKLSALIVSSGRHARA